MSEKSHLVTWFIDCHLRLNISSNIELFYELPLSFLGDDTQKEDILNTDLQTPEPSRQYCTYIFTLLFIFIHFYVQRNMLRPGMQAGTLNLFFGPDSHFYF